MRNRLFVALTLPKSIIDQIVTYRNFVFKDNRLKWESKEKLHLTIMFIGDVETETMNEISNELKFIEKYNSFNCVFTKFGFFHRENKPTVLWAGLETENTLLTLIDEINIRLNKFNVFVEKKKFNPHITLLRIKNDIGINFVNSFKNFTFTPIDFSANTISLYKSELHKEGSQYFEIKNYKLKKLEK